MNTKYTEEIKSDIHNLYNEGLTHKEIAELVGIKPKAVANLITRMGWANKRHNNSDRREESHTEESPKQQTAKSKVCHKCHKQNPDEANYCMNCGTDIRSKRKVLADKMQTLFSASRFYPEGVRNECVEILREVSAYLSSEND